MFRRLWRLWRRAGRPLLVLSGPAKVSLADVLPHRANVVYVPRGKTLEIVLY